MGPQSASACKVVDGTHARTEVPATHAPRFTVAPGVACIPVNELVSLGRPYANYTVVGSGKTGIDACLWLLDHGVGPSRIRWIMPRDAWFLDRANLQPGLENFERNMVYSLDQFGAIIEATSPADLFARLETKGALLRLDPGVKPTTYRCATVSRDELALLRTIANVVRLGRLRAIEPTRIVLDQGVLPAHPNTMYVDCSASAIQPLSGLPVFDDARINLLMVRFCQPVFSAALIAFVESHVEHWSSQFGTSNDRFWPGLSAHQLGWPIQRRMRANAFGSRLCKKKSRPCCESILQNSNFEISQI